MIVLLDLCLSEHGKSIRLRLLFRSPRTPERGCRYIQQPKTYVYGPRHFQPDQTIQPDQGHPTHASEPPPPEPSTTAATAFVAACLEIPEPSFSMRNASRSSGKQKIFSKVNWLPRAYRCFFLLFFRVSISFFPQANNIPGTDIETPVARTMVLL